MSAEQLHKAVELKRRVQIYPGGIQGHLSKDQRWGNTVGRAKWQMTTEALKLCMMV